MPRDVTGKIILLIEKASPVVETWGQRIGLRITSVQIRYIAGVITGQPLFANLGIAMNRSYFTYVLLIILPGICLQVTAQELPDAQELLDRSIAYHDPDGVWYQRNHTIEVISKRPTAADRISTVYLHHTVPVFGLDMQRDGHMIKTTLRDGACTATIDGSSEFTKEQGDMYRLSCEGITRWRDYHGYMLGLPMKLKDPGTIVDSEVQRTTFMDREVLSLRITYDTEVGADIWYMYLDPGTYALVGTRFYHDESKNDGEYIILEGEIEHAGIRLPKVRKWYYNNNAEYLGADDITDFAEGDVLERN